MTGSGLAARALLEVFLGGSAGSTISEVAAFLEVLLGFGSSTAAASGASVTSGLVSGAFLDALLGLDVSSTTSCSLIVSSSSAGSDFADLKG